MNNIQQLYHSSVTQNKNTSLPSNNIQSSPNPSTVRRTNPHSNTTFTLLLINTHNVSPNQNMNYQPISSSTLPISIVSNPIYINSSASTSEPIKHLDSRDHIYTPREYLNILKHVLQFRKYKTLN